MYKEKNYLLDLFSVVCTNNTESDKAPLLCRNRAKGKLKQGIKQRKYVYNNRHKFVFLCAKNRAQYLSLCKEYSPKPENNRGKEYNRN